MIKSVRIKLFLIFTVFLTFFIGLTLLMNLEFLEKYYFYKNKAIFYDAYERINRSYSNGLEDFRDTIDKIDVTQKIASVVLKKGSPMIKYYSRFRKGNEIDLGIIPKELANEIFIKRSQIKSDCVYEVLAFRTPNSRPTEDFKRRPSSGQGSKIHDLRQGDTRNKIEDDSLRAMEDIVFIKELDSGEILILRKPLHEIIENSKIANEFLLYVGLLTIILGSIFIFFLSKRLTGTIVELSHIAKGISNLDFSKKYKVKTKDEIGVLGDSINLISEELHKAMDDLMEANSKLKEDIERKKEIDEMRKNFISSVSHELKSPIGITKGYVEGLKYNIANNEEKKNRYYDILIDEMDRMDKMVKQILNLSTLESGVFELDETIFNISVLIEEVVEKYSPALREKDIDVKISADEDYFVKADYLRIEQVVCNYLINATNHVDEDKYIEIKAQQADKNVIISVINSGRNISEEDLESIWESFYKADKARSREYGGTGLGLSIVKSIIEHHQGKYGVINREIGVEFWFELNLINEE